MPSYKLKYFESRGFAEIPRLLFALKGQEYEDVRFNQETWPAEKKNTRFGVMPVLVIGDKQYGQSGAISRYLARTFKFYGKNDIEGMEIEQVLGIIQDMYNQMSKFYAEKDDTKKAELQKEGKEEKMPTYLNMLEKILNDNGSGFFVGSEISLADITVFDACDKLDVLYGLPLDAFPKVKKSRDMVADIPQIKAWVEKRPVTKM